jgi:Phenol hydroxylase, C-terminal dimerisation domain
LGTVQFHLNGFRPGDPMIASAEDAFPPRFPTRPLPAEVDVLVVGCGPTGLTLAAQLATFPDVSVRIADELPPDEPGSRLADLCDLLAADCHDSLVIGQMPSILRPRKGRYGLVDYEKVFCPDLKTGQDVFEMRGVDRDSGAIVVVRPDQHVAHVLPLDGFEELVEFLAGFMMPAS